VSNMWPGPADPDLGTFVRDMCDALAARGLHVERAVIDHRRSGPVRTPAKYAALLARAARAARPDVVYAHYLFPTGAIGAAVGALRGAPLVVTAHGGDVRNLGRPALRALTGQGLRRAAAVIAVSRHLAEELRASGLALPPVHVVNMGVDMGRFTPGERGAARAALGLAPDGPLVVAVGGLTERKNPLGLLLAFARLRAARPDARLAFVGDGPLAGAVDRGAARLGVAGAVLRPGAVPHERVVDWLRAADVLALVSHVEPLGQVALEALACGRPVVATRVGGTSEVVPVPRAGRVVSPSDPGAIAGALEELLRAPPTPEACRAAAAEHDLARQAARVAGILEEAIGAASVSP
jgi:glycosyltransferase involved in cell wall biosynthesis